MKYTISYGEDLGDVSGRPIRINKGPTSSHPYKCSTDKSYISRRYPIPLKRWDIYGICMGYLWDIPLFAGKKTACWQQQRASFPEAPPTLLSLTFALYYVSIHRFIEFGQ
jgi:hypothetical protein